MYDLRRVLPRWIGQGLHPGSIRHCPICDKRGQFSPYRGRQNARCPRCGSLERHRFMWPVLAHLGAVNPSWTVLHIAPEKCLQQHLADCFKVYITGDLNRLDVDMPGLDLCRMRFADDAIDMVIACHVLEHIERDDEAVREVHRVLRPGGVAILPVPFFPGETVEYGEPRVDEMGHWRRPGLDYLDRYREVFDVAIVAPKSGIQILPLCWKR
jgi:SAM-dependent methyltransferase